MRKFVFVPCCCQFFEKGNTEFKSRDYVTKSLIKSTRTISEFKFLHKFSQYLYFSHRRHRDFLLILFTQYLAPKLSHCMFSGVEI